MARILFIDDDPITLEILGRASEILGHQAILVYQSKAALLKVAQSCPDLVLVDMMMPEVDGLGVLAELRAQPLTASIPVIVLSAGLADDDRARVLAAGAQDYLNKPISLNVLMSVIQKYTTH